MSTDIAPMEIKPAAEPEGGLGTLTDVDRFAVLCFDTVVEGVPDLSPGLAVATDRNRFRAIGQLARTDARGGADLDALRDETIRLLTELTQEPTQPRGATQPQPGGAGTGGRREFWKRSR
jgi:Ca-activated chloride channel family protein